MAKIWPEQTIRTRQGDKVAIAPWIISASRATDIPAFYSEWFFDKLKRGYVQWINPFNRARPQYVSFENTKVIVFWSKNPAPLIPYLDELEKRKIAFYFQFTVNDYENEHLEPNVPPLEERIETFKTLATRFGKEKVIWRFDPLLLSDHTSPDQLIEKIRNVGERLHPFTEKLVFSFADIGQYRKVQSNLKKEGITYKDFDTKTMEYMAEKISAMNRNWGLVLGTCGEAIDFEEFGIIHNKCIDDELILRITDPRGRSLEFEKFLGYDRHAAQQLEMFEAPAPTKKVNLKDKGQRKECGCIYSKDIGSYDTCPHGCIYCYANSSQTAVEKNRQRITVESEALLS